MSDNRIGTSDLNQVLKKGTLLVIETGAYSDRNWEGPVRLLKDFKKADVVDFFLKQWKKPPDDVWNTYGPSPDEFLPWLVKNRYVEAVDGVSTWHVGSYSKFDP